MRKKIGIDADQVLTEIEWAFIDWHNYAYNTHHDNRRVYVEYLNEILSYSKEEWHTQWRLFYQTPFFKELPVIYGARETTRTLSEHHDLFVITARPTDVTGMKELTARWISHHFPNTFKGIMFSKKSNTKAKICAEHNIVNFIEDHIPYAREVSRQNIPVYLFGQRSQRKYGEHNNNIIVVPDWNALNREFDNRTNGIY